MPRQKKRYTNPVVPISAPTPELRPLSYSFTLKAASAYTGLSVWALRQAIYSKTLPVVNQKPYIIRRADLEAFVDSRAKAAA
jgi:hypothetical protein